MQNQKNLSINSFYQFALASKICLIFVSLNSLSSVSSNVLISSINPHYLASFGAIKVSLKHSLFINFRLFTIVSCKSLSNESNNSFYHYMSSYLSSSNGFNLNLCYPYFKFTNSISKSFYNLLKFKVVAETLKSPIFEHGEANTLLPEVNIIFALFSTCAPAKQYIGALYS